MPRYRISGLIVASDWELAGVMPLPDAQVPTDVTISCRSVPEALEAPTAQTRFWQVAGDRFLLFLPGIGRFLAIGGRELHMDAVPGSDPADALPFLTSTGMGVILHQRGALVLHASTVEWNGRGYAFCGRSGIGKSTLAAALCQAGGRLVADDVSAILPDGGGAPAVAPDGRMLKLFAGTISQLQLEHRRGAEVRSKTDKHFVAPPAGDLAEPIALAAIYLLRRPMQPVPGAVEQLSRLTAAQALLSATYRRRLALAYAGEGRMVALTAAVVQRVPVFTLAQKHDFSYLSETVAALRTSWEEAQEKC